MIGVRTAKTSRRSQLISTLVVLAVVIAGLLLINRSSDSSSGGPATRTTAGAADTRAADSPGAGRTGGAPDTGTRDTGTRDSRTDDTGASRDPDSGLAWVEVSALPAQAADTLALIRAGGPYPFPRNDDQTYFNNNRVLPRHPDGYYREYTVITPGAGNRGARRIIAGQAGELYYTGDHYDSFRRIRENR